MNSMMQNFKRYVAAEGRDGVLDPQVLDEVLRRFPWCTVARVIRSAGQETIDPQLAVVEAFRHPSSLTLQPVDGAALTTLTADDLIDRFLHEEDLRIVAEEGEAGEIRTEAQLDEEDELVTEELAEIYLAQGLKEEACAIYRKLSLRNPEKSVYFAELIEKTAKY